MEKILNINLQNRKVLYRILTETSRELPLKIPRGHRNNIWWNIAHVVVTQQILVYRLSNLPMRISDFMVDKFKKGSVPDGTATDEEIQMTTDLLFATMEWTKVDFENGLFKEFNEYTTSVKVTLKNIQDAMAFNIYHEGLHLGTILALQKML